MKKQIKIILLAIVIFILGCEADDPKSFYGGSDLLNLVESAWEDFRDGDYIASLAKFEEAKEIADGQTDTDTLLIHSTYGNIHTGIGWCNLRLLNANVARDNFIISQGYELFSFGTSVGLMASYFELGNEIPLDTIQINLAIDIGHWIFSSGMPEEFENDTTINVYDVRLIMAKSYYVKGDLTDNPDENSGALYWILQLNPEYDYLDENEPLSWYRDEPGNQEFDSFDKIILMIIWGLESEVFPA